MYTQTDTRNTGINATISTILNINELHSLISNNHAKGRWVGLGRVVREVR
jgi:hypothetical protein